jgi:hypothetical protein
MIGMTFRNGLITGTVVGLVGPAVLKAVSRNLIKGGYKGYRVVRQAAEELREDVEDIRAEAESELEGSVTVKTTKTAKAK